MPIKLKPYHLQSGGDIERGLLLEAINEAALNNSTLDLEPVRTSLGLTPEKLAEGLSYLAEKGFIHPVTDEAAGEVPWERIAQLTPTAVRVSCRYSLKMQGALDFESKREKNARLGEPERFTDRQGNTLLGIVSRRYKPGGKEFDGTFMLTICREGEEDGEPLFFKDGYDAPDQAWDAWEDYTCQERRAMDVVLWVGSIVPKFNDETGESLVHIDDESFAVFRAAVEALEDGKYAFPSETCVQHVDGVIVGVSPDGTGLRWPGLDPVEADPTDDGETAPEPDEWADSLSTWTSTTAGMMTIEARPHPKGWQARIGGEKLAEPRIQVIKSDPMPENDEELANYANEHFAPLFIKWVKAQP